LPRYFLSTLGGVIAACLLVSTRASAQTYISASPYSPTVYNEGPGIRLGGSPLTLHPGLALEAGYDSNVFYSPTNEIGSALLRLRAHLDMATLPPQAFAGDLSTADPKLDFRFSTQVEYREYLTGGAGAQAQRALNVTAGADLTVLPKGPFTLELSELFVRTVDPRNIEGPGQYTRDYNRTGLDVHYRMGALTLGLADAFSVQYWETPQLQYANSLSDEGRLYARLRLFQETYFGAQVVLSYYNYEHHHQFDAVPFRASVSASSMFTTWFGAGASIGYGNSFNLTGASYSNVIASADIRFLLPRRTKITLAYDRGFYDSVFANYYSDDHIWLGFDMPLVSRVSAHLDGGVRFRHYEGLVDASLVGASGYNPATTRDDIVYDARAEIGFRLTDWLSAGANYNLVGDSTDFTFLTNAGVPTRVSYIKHSAFGRIDIAY
jgi:hypothetical protein